MTRAAERTLEELRNESRKGVPSFDTRSGAELCTGMPVDRETAVRILVSDLREFGIRLEAVPTFDVPLVRKYRDELLPTDRVFGVEISGELVARFLRNDSEEGPVRWERGSFWTGPDGTGCPEDEDRTRTFLVEAESVEIEEGVSLPPVEALLVLVDRLAAELDDESRVWIEPDPAPVAGLPRPVLGERRSVRGRPVVPSEPVPSSAPAARSGFVRALVLVVLGAALVALLSSCGFGEVGTLEQRPEIVENDLSEYFEPVDGPATASAPAERLSAGMGVDDSGATVAVGEPPVPSEVVLSKISKVFAVLVDLVRSIFSMAVGS